MSGYYSYILSTLPGLHYGMNPPFSMEDFIKKLTGFIPEDEQRTIREYATEKVDVPSATEPVGRMFAAFETTLRNHLVRLRSTDLGVSPEKYLKSREEKIDQRIERYASEAYKNQDPLESERILDQTRWNCLEEMESGHIFNFSALLIYTLKLKILLKWHVIDTADKAAVFNETLSSFNLKELPINRS
ncbi:MAG: DUF2764 family protein [Deltaproteobacteria bacterium]|nr:DUF2764 family protein [Deltaproteobacteria bacterium]